MARLYKRGKTWWCYLRGGARISTRCTDKRAAEIAAAKFERESADENHAARSRATFQDGTVALHEELRARGRAAATLSRCTQKLGHFGRLWGRDLLLRHITATLVAKYIEQRREEKASGTTIRDELAFLRQMLAVARRRGIRDGHPDDVLPLLFEAGHRPVQRCITADQARQLLACLAPHRAAVVAFILATGARLGEAFRARRDDVDLEARVVFIRGTKTKGALAPVPITPVSEPWLRFAMEHADERRLRAGHDTSPTPGANGPLLRRGTLGGDPQRSRLGCGSGPRTSTATDRALPDATQEPRPLALFAPWPKLHRDVAAAARRAGIPATTPNDWRRSLGHWLAGEGATPTHIAGILRHETDKLAQTTYARMVGAELGRAMESSVPALYETSAAQRDQLDKLEFVNPRTEGAKRRKWRRMVVPPRGVEPLTNALGKPWTMPALREETSALGMLCASAVPYFDTSGAGELAQLEAFAGMDL